MATIRRFEDLECWKSARILTRKVYLYSKDGRISEDWDTLRQFRRATLSIMNNIAEGFGRSSKKERVRFLEISSSSSSEVKSMLYLIEDIAYLPANRIQEIRELNEKTYSLTIGLINYLKGR
ncbi:MAG: four helix bundle protein [Lewinellaceae bacterium]|nr:four helix bundle protein [Lewinellaceae bacterium]